MYLCYLFCRPVPFRQEVTPFLCFNINRFRILINLLCEISCGLGLIFTLFGDKKKIPSFSSGLELKKYNPRLICVILLTISLHDRNGEKSLRWTKIQTHTQKKLSFKISYLSHKVYKIRSNWKDNENNEKQCLQESSTYAQTYTLSSESYIEINQNYYMLRYSSI